MRAARQALAPFASRYGEEADDEPDRLHSDIFHGTRQGGLGLLRDLHDLYLMATECDITWTVVGQAAYGADDELSAVVSSCEGETATELKWLRTRMKSAAPQALVVHDHPASPSICSNDRQRIAVIDGRRHPDR